MKQKRANTISLSGNMLKLIAMITMIIDHIGGVILETGVMQYQNEAVNNAIGYFMGKSNEYHNIYDQNDRKDFLSHILFFDRRRFLTY